jgi:hypothetical protein
MLGILPQKSFLRRQTHDILYLKIKEIKGTFGFKMWFFETQLSV